MAKLGPYSYPDIRFGDAVEIAGRILSKFKGIVNVKGLAWELGMAENSGTLFAKIATLRDFGLVDGRGELRVTSLAQRILHPSSPEEGRRARAEAFRRVELLRLLHERFDGDVPDDVNLMVGLEQITRAPRDEIVRRVSLIQKHLVDAARVLARPPALAHGTVEHSAKAQQTLSARPGETSVPARPRTSNGSTLYVSAGPHRLELPLAPEFVELAIGMLQRVKAMLEKKGAEPFGEGEGDDAPLTSPMVAEQQEAAASPAQWWMAPL